jgi:hypothetical protein
VTKVQITFQTCARCARPVTTAGTAAGGGGLKIHDFWGATGWWQRAHFREIPEIFFDQERGVVGGEGCDEQAEDLNEGW